MATPGGHDLIEVHGAAVLKPATISPAAITPPDPRRDLRSGAGPTKNNSNDRCPAPRSHVAWEAQSSTFARFRMGQGQTTDNEVTASGLLLSVEPLTAAVDRGKANGAVADNDGND